MVGREGDARDARRRRVKRALNANAEMRRRGEGAGGGTTPGGDDARGDGGRDAARARASNLLPRRFRRRPPFVFLMRTTRHLQKTFRRPREPQPSPAERATLAICRPTARRVVSGGCLHRRTLGRFSKRPRAPRPRAHVAAPPSAAAAPAARHVLARLLRRDAANVPVRGAARRSRSPSLPPSASGAEPARPPSSPFSDPRPGAFPISTRLAGRRRTSTRARAWP